MADAPRSSLEPGTRPQSGGAAGVARAGAPKLRVLILGGTTEGRELAERLAGRAELEVTLSLAGRTAQIVEQAVPLRIGGFGGTEGLVRHLREARIDVLIDATHPFAAIMSSHAAAAANAAGLAFVALRRPPWAPVQGDRWTRVCGVEEAVSSLGSAPRRVFLALGRQEIRPFCAAPQHFYLVRSVDPVDPPLAVQGALYVVERGPFGEAGDRALLLAHRIDVVISRNSGGSAAYAKIAAARALGVPVILLERPALASAPAVPGVEEALAWLDQLRGPHHGSAGGAERGV
jgi:precorrin-6A/cobalt-precorrin-6A reductase